MEDGAHALPGGLAYQLLHTLGLTEQQVSALSLQEAVALITAHWSTPPA